MVCPLHLGFEAATTTVVNHVQPGVTQTLGNTDCQVTRGIPLMNEVDIRGFCLRQITSIFQQGEQTLDTEGKATGWRGLATQLFHEAIITTTGTDSTLRAERIRDPFKDSQVVIIQTAYQTGIDGKGNTRMAHEGLYALEVGQ